MDGSLIPTELQVLHGLYAIENQGIVFEGIDSFPHNRGDDYASALRANGSPMLIGIGVEVINQGWMYAVFDGDRIDVATARKLIRKRFA